MEQEKNRRNETEGESRKQKDDKRVNDTIRQYYRKETLFCNRKRKLEGNIIESIKA